MRRIAVIVATTSGPVRVERITREPAPQSMVCLKRTSTILPISAAYDSFVRPGSGVIERIFGPFEGGAFRLDVSAPIDTGESWQLGFFVAHAVAAAAEAAVLSTEDEADDVIWLSGPVDYDLGVGGVGHMAEKVHASAEALARWLAGGKAVTMFVRAGADYDAAVAAGVSKGVRLVPVVSATDALTTMDLALPLAVAHVPVLLRRPAQRLRYAVAFGILAVAALPFVSEWLMPRATDPLEPTANTTSGVAAAPAPSSTSRGGGGSVVAEQPNLAIIERRAPAGHTCAEVQFGKVSAVESPVVADPGAQSTSTLDGLCGLGVVVDNGTRARFVVVALDVLSGNLLYGTERPQAFDGQTSFVGRQQWPVDLPRRMPQPFEIRATAVSADHPTAQGAQQLKTKAEVTITAGDLRAEGTVAMVHHRVLP